MTDDILLEQKGDWGVITLNRPKALNALSWDMTKALYAALVDWQEDAAVKAVLIKGAGEKAFCAGGDIRWLCQTAGDDLAAAQGFFFDEYRTNAKIHHYPKPYVALIDGIVMGGGVGVSVHGAYRVAGDNTLFAMPETGIGLFPDVGGGYFMPRLDGGLGLYLALTGQRMKAADCVYCGVATHYTPTAQNAALEDGLLAEKLSGDDSDKTRIERVLSEFSEQPGDAPSLAEIRGEMDRLFVGPQTLDDLMAGLKQDDSAFAQKTFKTLSNMSPTSMRITFEQMRRGGTLSFDEVMRMEYRMVCRVMQGHDFFEGVRAVILDKDGAPKWHPATIEAVGASEVEAYFESLNEKELPLP